MSELNSKLRILMLVDIFKHETDEYNMLSVEDLINKLKEKYYLYCYKNNITIHDVYIKGTTIKDDMQQLEASGFSICSFNISHGKKFYYHHERLFEEYELRMLIDSICSARFITKDDTEKLVKKINSLTSNYLSKKLDNHIQIDEMVKIDDKTLKFALYTIHEAISESKKISFQYGNYNVDKEFILHHNGNYYTAEPYGLVWNNDYYYLICTNTTIDGIKRTNIINYRIDRMRNVIKLDGSNAAFIKHNFDIAKHIANCFNMYPGEVYDVEIQFKNKLINAVIDRFGKNIHLSKIDKESFKIRAQMAINEGLLRWILNWGADAKVLWPNKLIKMVQDEIEKMHKMY